MENCYHAARGFFDECGKYPTCGCKSIAPQLEDEPQERKLNQKDDSAVVDPKSTGRKRAAKLFPLDREAPCEWRGQKFRLEKDDEDFFIGCEKGLQQNIHHGPNKDTLVNEVGNVWRICSTCHNRYHAKIDPTYDWNRQEFYPIQLFVADEMDRAKNEMYWISRGQAKAGSRSVNPND
jgi:hypothetical protein